MENNNGGKNSYYDIDVSLMETIDVDTISEMYGFNPYEFNILKALVGTAGQRNYGKSRHIASNADKLRDYRKALYYANKNLVLGENIYSEPIE